MRCASLAGHPRLPELAGLPALRRRPAHGARPRARQALTMSSSADGDERDLVRLIGSAPRGRTLAAALSRRRGSRRRSCGRSRRLMVCRCRLSWSTGRPRPRAFPAPAETALSGRRARRGVCIIPAAAPRPISTAPGRRICSNRALRPCHCCLSPQVARPLLAAGAADIRIAARPDEAALFELI